MNSLFREIISGIIINTFIVFISFKGWLLS